MDGERFDRITAAWAGRVGRRSALRTAAGALAALLAAAPLASPRADAANRARRRCRRKQGVFVATGECRCASRCQPLPTDFPCHGNQNCFCGEAAAGGGFCGDFANISSTGCSQEPGEACPTGFTCVVHRGCPASGGACTTKAQCPTASYGCINGRCEQTSCYTPCPT
jgi:hypothetical protein